jgi:hypothetical protein
MANATATKKLNDAKKKAAEGEAKAAPKKEAPATRPQRVSALVNITTAKTIEGQFDTTSKKVDDLGQKLAEIEAKFAGRPEHPFAIAASEAREELAKAAEAVVASKEKFGSIRSTLEDFFG